MLARGIAERLDLAHCFCHGIPTAAMSIAKSRRPRHFCHLRNSDILMRSGVFVGFEPARESRNPIK